jgi:hypothetical protein
MKERESGRKEREREDERREKNREVTPKSFEINGMDWLWLRLWEILFELP